MSLRPPQFFSGSLRWETGASILEAELAGERASTLGRLGRAAEAAVRRLRETPAGEPDRAGLVRAAADAVWCYFIQREILGLRDHRDPIAEYGIPREVLVRLGAIEPAGHGRPAA